MSLEPPAISPFIDQLVDWRDFELFVRDLYAREEKLCVEHNVTELGRSGAKRQIDVKITEGSGAGAEVTLVECKRWKEPVSRDRVDILFAAIDDLGAKGGVIFTTKGYEAGAESFAKSKGIELFVVRDLTDAEWGLPGRSVWFYMHIYAAKIEDFASKAELLALGTKPPSGLSLTFDLTRKEPEPRYLLRSPRDDRIGANLVDVLLRARMAVLQALARGRGLFDQGAEGQRAFRIPVEIDLSGTPLREMLLPEGLLRLDRVSFGLLAVINQSRFEFDRGRTFDLALAVENYVTRKRSIVSRRGAAGQLALEALSSPPEKDVHDSDVFENGNLMQIFAEPWVELGEVRATIQKFAPVSFGFSPGEGAEFTLRPHPVKI